MASYFPSIVSELAFFTQLGMVALFSIFFFLLSRTLKLNEVLCWSLAWLADLLSLLCVFVLLYTRLPGVAIHAAVAGYAFFKILFVVMILFGAGKHAHPGAPPLMEMRRTLLLAGGWGIALGFLSPGLRWAQMGQDLMVGVLMTGGGIWLFLHSGTTMSRWLGGAITIHGIVFLHYVPFLTNILLFNRVPSNHLQLSNFLDSGAELVIALASLVALQSSTYRHLQEVNDDLRLSRERISQLIDTDPLTNLLNRRRFREEMAQRANDRTLLLFLDLDDFKTINDRFGHSVGDVCLKRVASVLLAAFRPDDAIFRWGGDEFLAVCRNLGIEQARERLEKVRHELHRPGEGCPPCHMSAGITVVESGERLEEALSLADERMYEDKASRRATDLSGRFRCFFSETTGPLEKNNGSTF